MGKDRGKKKEKQLGLIILTHPLFSKRPCSRLKCAKSTERARRVIRRFYCGRKKGRQHTIACVKRLRIRNYRQKIFVESLLLQYGQLFTLFDILIKFRSILIKTKTKKRTFFFPFSFIFFSAVILFFNFRNHAYLA